MTKQALLFTHIICLIMSTVLMIWNTFLSKKPPIIKKSTWITVHVSTHIISTLIGFIGVSCSFFMIENDPNGSHLSSVHSVLGISLFIIQSFVLPLIGFQLPSFQLIDIPGRTIRPTDHSIQHSHAQQRSLLRIHKLLAYSVFVLASVNMLLGISRCLW